jgi:hypothetical protein
MASKKRRAFRGRGADAGGAVVVDFEKLAVERRKLRQIDAHEVASLK